MNKLRMILASLGLLVVLTAPLQASATDVYKDACSNPSAANSSVCKGKTQATNPVSGTNGVLLKVVRLLSVIAGALAVIVIIIAGIRMITSQGDAAGVAGARNTVIYAAIGLVVIVIAQSIISYVITSIYK